MKNKLFAAFLVVGLGAFAFASLAGAQATSTVTSTVKDAIKAQFNQKVEISSNGQAQIRGTVVGTSTSAVMVKSWGGIWTAEISTGTIILAQGGKAELKDIKSGDEVAVHGKMVEGKAITVAAKTIKDYSLRLDNSKKLSDEKKVAPKPNEKREEVRKNMVQKMKDQFKKKISNQVPPEKITVSGNVICLPKKNPGEVQTLECAIGLESNGKNYGLKFEDGSRFETGKSVTVSGKLLPAVNSIYNIVGVIQVSD